MIVTMPDGQQVQFPNDMPREQIKAMIASKYPEVGQQAAEPVLATPEPSFLDRASQAGQGFLEGQRKRGSQFADSVAAGERDEQTGAETAFQGLMGNVIGGAADVVGAPIGFAAQEGFRQLPEGGQEAVRGVGEAVAPIAEAYERNQQAFNTANPRAGRNLQAVREGVNLLPFASKPVRSAGEAVMKTGGSATKNVAKSVIPEAPLPIYKAAPVKEASANLYKSLDDVGGVLKPEARVRLIDKAEELADIGGERLTSDKSIFENIFETLSTKKEKPITLKGAESLDKELTGLIQKERTLAGMSPEGVKLMELQDDLRDVLRNPSEDMVIGGRQGFDALKDATNQWSAGKKLEEIENILDYANKTDNPATSIKAQFRTLSRNKKRMAGYNKAERKFINKAAESGKFANFLRTTAGSRLISSMLGSIGGAVGGGAPGALVGAGAGAAIAGGARKAATGLQKGRVKNLQKEVSKRVQIPKEIYKMNPKQAKEALKKFKAGD